MKQIIAKHLCELHIDHMTPDEAIAEIARCQSAHAERCKGSGETLEIRVTGEGDSYADYGGEVYLIAIRQETDAEESAREAADKAFLDARERSEYVRLRAKFEKPVAHDRDTMH